jgi:steroid Delta-isomerase
MGTNTEAQVRHVYEQWHRTILERDLKGLAALYAEDAIFESPAVWVLNRQSDGVLRGRAAIESYFATFFEKAAGSIDWYRSDVFLSDGKRLFWEYPRQTPTGEQTEIAESMELDGGLISVHRVYWGWVGFKNLVARIDR